MTRSRTFTYRAEFMIGETDMIADIRYSFVPAHSGHGPSHASGGDPPEAASIEDAEVVSLQFEKQEPDVRLSIPTWLADLIIDSVGSDSLIDHAEDSISAERERAAEDRYEARRDDR